MRRTYETWNPKPKTLELLGHAERIAAQYAAAGYELTLRGLYYRLVAGAILEENSMKAYNALIYTLTKGRMAGLFDWSYVTDNERYERRNSHWTSPESIIDSAAAGYAIDKWEGQPRRVVVWVEKNALSNVVGRVCDAEDVPWLACKGYMSVSEMWDASRRIGRWLSDGTAVTMLHLGDHDPSGIDMTRDIRDRLSTFLHTDYGRYMADSRSPDDRPTFEVQRIALTMDQVQTHNPPPNPAKLTDSRAHGDDGYVARFGYESWELDALPPETLDALIREHSLMIRDADRWADREESEQDDRNTLNEVSTRWHDIVRYLREDE